MEKTVQLIIEEVIKRLNVYSTGKLTIPIGISNRHVHLSKKDLEVLFGEGYQLTVMKKLRQPGQFAAKETVTVTGPKGSFENVRVLGPVRGQTQLEISVSDGYKLGFSVPIRESGDTEGTPGIILKGPKGIVEKDRGVIAALRHIHMPLNLAEHFGLKDKDRVSAEAGTTRRLLFHNVLVRVSDQYLPELHLDTDEANAGGIQNGDIAYILKD